MSILTNPLALHADPLTLPVEDRRRAARSLYWRGWEVSQIAGDLQVPRTTVQSWKDRGKWDDAPSIRRMEDCLEARWTVLIAKIKKTGEDYKEIDLLGRQIAALAKVRRYEAPGGHEGDLNDKVANRNSGPRKEKAKPNHFTAEQVADLRAIFEERLYGFQKTWWANMHLRTRMVLKSRQIGATYYFSFEALLDAIESGRNQIFLSASKAQAHQFRNYIVGFAKLVGVDLKGDPMMITSDVRPEGEAAAELHFLGTNFRTAQGRSGNFYFDEFFWTHNFEELNKVASAMATHTHWRKTYFSTPSTVAHLAHPYWTGERRNRRKKKEDRITLDVSHAALKDGRMCEDGIWRQIVTVHDAIASGFDKVNLDELHDDHPDDEFANLFGCEFVDDSLSAFRFNDLTALACDSLVDWVDFDPEAARPYGNRPVWAGYDPQNSEDGDNAALVIMAPPTAPGGKFRILERHQLRGLDFEQQAEFIKRMLSRYTCTYLGIDATGVGAGVHQLLAKADSGISGVTKIEYSLEVKQAMVMKAQNVVRRGRLAFDGFHADIISSFISIKKTITTSGRNVTFKAGRGGDDGHADIAWAAMHVLINEPLDGKEAPKSTLEMIE